MLSTLVWLCIAILGLLWLFRRWKSLGHPNVPGPKGYPLLGSMGGFFDRSHAGLTSRLLATTHEYLPSPIVKIENILLTTYLVGDARTVHAMCESRAQEFINHPELVGSKKILTSKGLIGIRDDTWRKRRKQLSGHFISSKIAQMVSELFVNHATTLVSKIDETKHGDTLNIQKCFTNMTMDVIGDAAFGTDFGAQRNSENAMSQAVKLWLDSAAKLGLLAIFPFWDKIPLEMVRQFFVGQNMLADMCSKVIEDRKKTGESRNDLVQSLVDIEDEVDRSDLLGEALLFLVAGHETTSTTLTWAIYMISKHPEVEKKILYEIDEVLGEEIPNQDNVHKLKYLDSVVQETLRYYPPALLTTRENSNSLVLEGYTFPKQTMFLIPIWGLHHDERYWENPDKFDPERWTPENRKKHVHGAFLPFGLGPRMCIGYKFALMEAKVALAMLYQKFTFKYSQPGEPEIKVGSLYRTEQLLVEVHKRV